MAATKTDSNPPMTEAHKAALAEGRASGRVVRDYLSALELNRPKRGRKRTAESIVERLEQIELALPTSPPLVRLKLVQDRIDLRQELEVLESKADMTAEEDAFVDVAAGYSARKGISYDAWRELGVPTDVLRRAGIKRPI
jgi:hypothetical protein